MAVPDVLPWSWSMNAIRSLVPLTVKFPNGPSGLGAQQPAGKVAVRGRAASIYMQRSVEPYAESLFWLRLAMRVHATSIASWALGQAMARRLAQGLAAMAFLRLPAVNPEVRSGGASSLLVRTPILGVDG